MSRVMISHWTLHGATEAAIKYISPFFLFFLFFLVYLTFVSASGMIWVWGTDSKYLERTGTLSFGAGRLWGGPLRTNTLLSCSCPCAPQKQTDGLQPKGKVPPGSRMQKMSALIACRGVLLFQSISLEQHLCQKWGFKFKCIEANQSLFSIY